MKRKYPIAVELSGSDNTYGVVFPDIPGCYSAGDTLDEAIENAKEALEGFLELGFADGDEIPEAGSIDSHKNNKDFKDFIWSVVEVDITPFNG